MSLLFISKSIMQMLLVVEYEPAVFIVLGLLLLD